MRDGSMPGRLIGAAAILIAVVACAMPGASEEPAAPPDTAGCASELDVVEASETVIHGELSSSEIAMVTWALGRFELAGLSLPADIEVEFDPSGDHCESHTGWCIRPNGTAKAIVCEPVFDTAASVLDHKITLLHEFAHLWHWGCGDGTAWSDFTDAVGGEYPERDVAWADRMNERVATVIGWGLLDQRRRPVELDISCADLRSQFAQLTGRAPLGPLDIVCLR